MRRASRACGRFIIRVLSIVGEQWDKSQVRQNNV
jgi:hypothetical protein